MLAKLNTHHSVLMAAMIHPGDGWCYTAINRAELNNASSHIDL